MAKKFRTGRFLFLAILLIAIAVFAFVKYVGEDNVVIARVNGYELAKDYVEARSQLVPPSLKASLTFDDFLEQTINSLLIFQEAERQGYAVRDEEVDSRIESLRAGLGLGEEDFRRQLLSEGISFEDFRKDFGRSMTISKFVEAQVSSSIEVSEEEIDEAAREFSSTGLDASTPEARLQLSDQLRAMKTQRALRTLADQLRAKAEIIRQ